MAETLNAYNMKEETEEEDVHKDLGNLDYVE
jgi:hypothetical protein